MRCTSPLRAWRTESGGISFKEEHPENYGALRLACGKCIGCRVNNAQQWALRCHFEARQRDQNSFITLTYRTEDLPKGGSIQLLDWQLFVKRLRRRLWREDPKNRISYFACAEYGEDQEQPTGLGRPHFHAIIFGYQWPDLELVGKNHCGDARFTSSLLERDWGKGLVEIGEVTLRSAGYVARYNMKKITGDEAKERYFKCNSHTGESWPVEPERMMCSKRPAIGKSFLEKYKPDFEKGFIMVEGKRMALPKYYKKLLEAEGSEEYRKSAIEQEQSIQELSDQQLDTSREAQQLRAGRLKRNKQ